MMRIGAVMLAAGRSERFGTNKLLADFNGRPMVCRAFDTLKQLNTAKTVVVVSCMEIAEMARGYGFDVVINDAPQLGQARSICLGVSYMEKIKEMEAVLLMVADQPLLSLRSLAALMTAFEQDKKGIACLRDETHSGNPAIFARTYFDKLMRLEGDRGAKGILRENMPDLNLVDCLHPMELADADDPAAMELLRRESSRIG